MKKELLPSLILSVLTLVLCCIIYPAIVYCIGLASPGKGEGETITTKDGKRYYINIAQSFTGDKYFWPRPSAVGYNAAGSGGSNKGPNNPDLLTDIQKRIDTFMVHNPGINKADIPSDLVTASGSGLDPDISIQGARVQAKRIAHVRGISEDAVQQIISKNIEKPLFGLFGPAHINVLRLNIDLDNMSKS